jgi:hypothetical protein
MTRIAFKPNWNRDDKSAPFKRNKATKLDIPVLDHRESGA